MIDARPCSRSPEKAAVSGRPINDAPSSPFPPRLPSDTHMLSHYWATPDSAANSGAGKFSSPSPSVMRFFFVCFFVGGVFGGSRAQVSDRETTLGPLPPSSFSCRGRPPGYYADLDTGCKTYHVCDGLSHFTYVCPPRTLFRQTARICDHAYLVSCDDALLDERVPALFYSGEEEEVAGDGDLVLDPEENHLKEGRVPDEDYDDLRGTTEEFTTGKTFEPTTFEPTTTSSSTSTSTSSIRPRPEKYLKVSITDFRSLFYIPEVKHNSIAGGIVRELFVPLDRDRINFGERSRGRASKASSCPTHCEPRFLLPGTCHPCVMIK